MGRHLLSPQEAKRFYDRFGARQDRQAFYEDKALTRLTDEAAFGAVSSVVEFGCGTGRFAENLLRGALPESASYTGFDISATMVSLAHQRLLAFGNRAKVTQIDGTMPLPLAENSCDRFLSTYVLDLLPDDQIRAVIKEAGRLLLPGGYICLTGLTSGIDLPSRLSIAIWRALHRIRPALVGGCRPIELGGYFDPADWVIMHDVTVVSWGMPSEVLVARKHSAGTVRAR